MKWETLKAFGGARVLAMFWLTSGEKIVRVLRMECAETDHWFP